MEDGQDHSWAEPKLLNAERKLGLECKQDPLLSAPDWGCEQLLQARLPRLLCHDGCNPEGANPSLYIAFCPGIFLTATETKLR